MQIQENQNIHSKPTRKVGFVLKTHGFNGHLKLQIQEDDFQLQDFLLVDINNKFVPFLIADFNEAADIVLLDGFNNSESVQFLLGREILAFSGETESELPDLHGYTLIDLNSGLQYQISAVIEMPSQLLLEFRVGYKDCLLPFHEDLISEIDHETKTIKAVFPDGLLDL